MDTWKYYDITHSLHLICNPILPEKFERLCSLLTLNKDSNVLDIACGKGEFLVRLAELYKIKGTGVDISPYCINDCLEKQRKRVPNAKLKFLEMDAKKYRPTPGETFDLAICLGASWIFDDFQGTIQALSSMVKPNGLLVIGEPFWLEEPCEEYLNSCSIKKDDLAESHYINLQIGEAEGFNCIYFMVSNHDDWDNYEALQWLAVDEYSKANPGDPDLPIVLERKKKDRENYLRWGREMQGWAVYVFRKK
jgi:SAM-dependent methyltransferase